MEPPRVHGGELIENSVSVARSARLSLSPLDTAGKHAARMARNGSDCRSQPKCRM